MAAGRKTGGRTKGTPNKVGVDLRDAAQKFTDDALKTLASIMRDSESDAARVSAANSILDRGHGKPSQHLDVEAEVGLTIEVVKFGAD